MIGGSTNILRMNFWTLFNVDFFVIFQVQRLYGSFDFVPCDFFDQVWDDSHESRCLQ